MVWPPSPLTVPFIDSQTIFASFDNDQSSVIDALVAHLVAAEATLAATAAALVTAQAEIDVLQAAPANVELAYAEITTTPTTAALGAANGVDIVGLIITVPATTRPIAVEFQGYGYNGTVNDGVLVALIEAAAGDANRTPARQIVSRTSSPASQLGSLNFRRRFAASASARTFKMQLAALTGGTAGIYGAADTIVSLSAVQL